MELVDAFMDNAARTYKIIRAGHFHPAMQLDTSGEVNINSDMPRKPEILVGTGALAVASTTAINAGISALETASALAVDALAGISGMFGTTILARHYMHCKKASEETVRGFNMAGQSVEGTRLDLYCLHNAQQEIVSLSMNFNAAAPPHAVQRQIEKIIDESKEYRSRVKVSDAQGMLTGEAQEYRFVRPLVQLVDAKPARSFTTPNK